MSSKGIAMFLTIQGGEYTINVNLISEIEWGDETADVTMVTGVAYTVDGEDYKKLRKIVGLD